MRKLLVLDLAWFVLANLQLSWLVLAGLGWSLLAFTCLCLGSSWSHWPLLGLLVPYRALYKPHRELYWICRVTNRHCNLLGCFKSQFFFLGSHCIDKFDYWCPIYKKAYGCSFVIRPDFRDSINNLCPMTCGLCGAMHHVSPWRPSEQYHGVVQNWSPGSQYGVKNRIQDLYLFIY